MYIYMYIYVYIYIRNVSFASCLIQSFENKEMNMNNMSKHKKEESSNGKFKKIGIFYTLGLLLILSRIPWTNWLA